MPLPYSDRHHAGRNLAHRLHCYAGDDTVVLALPRGGVPVAYEVAHALRAPMEIFLLRHLVAPRGDGAAFGVVASGGVRVLDRGSMDSLAISHAQADEITRRERISLFARERTYRGAHDMLELEDRVVIMVDDGMTAPARLREAVAAVRAHAPRAVVLALPVLEETALPVLRHMVDDLVVAAPAAPGLPRETWYQDLPPVSHAEVRALLGLVAAEAQSRQLALVEV